MATSVYEENWSLRVRKWILSEPSATTYPYQAIVPEAANGDAEMATIVLDNPFLRLRIAPSLGGRIVSVYDKRTDREILAPVPPGFAPCKTPTWPYSAWQLDLGIQIQPLGPAHPALCAPMTVATTEDDDGAQVRLSGLLAGTGLGLQIAVDLPPDLPEFSIAVRTTQRCLYPRFDIPFLGQVETHIGAGGVWVDPQQERVVWYDKDRDVGLALQAPHHAFEHIDMQQGALQLARFVQASPLMPRQVDESKLRVMPLSGLGVLTSVGPGASVGLHDTELRIQSSRNQPGAKLVVGMHTEETFETNVELTPESVLAVPLQSLPARPTALMIRDQSGDVLLRWEQSSPMLTLGQVRGTAALEPSSRVKPDARMISVPGVSEYLAAIKQLSEDEDPSRLLYRAARFAATKAPAYSALGVAALRAGVFELASEHFESALLFNGESHLDWWMKALSERLTGRSNDDGPELPNAHFLAPDDPVLRAEAFLSQRIVESSEPLPFLDPLRDDPEAVLEVVCLLLDAGLFAEASRLIGELQRGSQIPSLRYLLAYGYLKATRLNAEAANQVRLAAELPIEPPYPWRPIEIRAMETLQESGLGDARLRQLLLSAYEAGFSSQARQASVGAM